MPSEEAERASQWKNTLGAPIPSQSAGHQFPKTELFERFEAGRSKGHSLAASSRRRVQKASGGTSSAQKKQIELGLRY